MTIKEQKLILIELQPEEALAIKALLHGETHRKLTTKLSNALELDASEEVFDRKTELSGLDIQEGANFLLKLAESL